MATTTSITTTYAGEFAGKYVSAALLSADTIEGGGITIKPNVKYKEVLKTMNLDAITKDATCDFSDTSTLTLAEKVLTPKEMQVNLELCKSDFVSDWEAISMGYSAFSELVILLISICRFIYRFGFCLLGIHALFNTVYRFL